MLEEFAVAAGESQELLHLQHPEAQMVEQQPAERTAHSTYFGESFEQDSFLGTTIHH